MADDDAARERDARSRSQRFLFSFRRENREKIRRIIGRIIVPGRLFRAGIYFRDVVRETRREKTVSQFVPPLSSPLALLSYRPRLRLVVPNSFLTFIRHGGSSQTPHGSPREYPWRIESLVAGADMMYRHVGFLISFSNGLRIHYRARSPEK